MRMLKFKVVLFVCTCDYDACHLTPCLEQNVCFLKILLLKYSQVPKGIKLWKNNGKGLSSFLRFEIIWIWKAFLSLVFWVWDYQSKPFETFLLIVLLFLFFLFFLNLGWHLNIQCLKYLYDSCPNFCVVCILYLLRKLLLDESGWYILSRDSHTSMPLRKKGYCVLLYCS